jgi:ABC-type transport system involved in cytochrome c biogenesis ATPase subunit
MIEPTVTQNSALYLAHQKASKEKAALFRRFRFWARKERVARKQPTLSELFT